MKQNSNEYAGQNLELGSKTRISETYFGLLLFGNFLVLNGFCETRSNRFSLGAMKRESGKRCLEEVSAGVSYRGR